MENLLDVRLSPLEGQQQGQQPSAAAVLAAALRATAAQQEKMQAALAEQRTVNRAYQEQVDELCVCMKW